MLFEAWENCNCSNKPFVYYVTEIHFININKRGLCWRLKCSHCSGGLLIQASKYYYLKNMIYILPIGDSSDKTEMIPFRICF